MSRTKQRLVEDRLWELIEPLLPPRPALKGPGGRPRVDERAALEGILFVLHTGCRWRDLPLQLPPPERAAALRTAAGAVAPGGSLLVVAHDARNRRDGVGGPGDERVLHHPDDVVAPGFAEARHETARRPVGDRDALDTVVRLVRPA